MINVNASEYFPINIDDYVLSYTVLETKNTKEEKKTRVLIYAAPEHMVKGYYVMVDGTYIYVDESTPEGFVIVPPAEGKLQ